VNMRMFMSVFKKPQTGCHCGRFILDARRF
jgi:hypothetical protein